eukprot:gene11671-biopygen15435
MLSGQSRTAQGQLERVLEARQRCRARPAGARCARAGSALICAGGSGRGASAPPGLPPGAGLTRARRRRLPLVQGETKADVDRTRTARIESKGRHCEARVAAPPHPSKQGRTVCPCGSSSSGGRSKPAGSAGQLAERACAQLPLEVATPWGWGISELSGASSKFRNFGSTIPTRKNGAVIPQGTRPAQAVIPNGQNEVIKCIRRAPH